ncbi:MAG: glycosyltransferase family 4 protein [Synechococcus sp.]
MSRTTVLHLVGDRKMGGIASTLKLLQDSHLAETHNFLFLETDGNPQDALRIAKTLKGIDIVAIHFAVRTANLATLVWIQLLSKLLSFKIILIEHHYSQRFQEIAATNPNRLQRALAIAGQLVDRVIAVSPPQQQWLSGFIPASKLVTIASCSCLQTFWNIPERPPHQGPLRVVSYGRHSLPAKGFDILIEAAKLLQDLPIQIAIGGQGPDTQQLRHLAAATNNVKIVAPIPDVPCFLDAADVVVIPSRWEPWGLTCTEAKAAGRPVIVSCVDGLIDRVQDCGLAVPPDSPKELAAALRRLSSDSNRQQLREWGRAARDSVRSAESNYISAWAELLNSQTAKRCRYNTKLNGLLSSDSRS